MLTALILILLAVHIYRKNDIYNPYDTRMIHSSYYDAAYCKEGKCYEEVYEMLHRMAGYKRIFINCRFMKDGMKYDLIMLHESGIYVMETKDYTGWISGNPEGIYWIQDQGRESWFSNKNYFYNPFLKIKSCIDILRWELKDMPWIPYYSLAVFGNRCRLELPNYMENERWAVPLNRFAYTIDDIFRHNKRFLKPEMVDEIYGRFRNMMEPYIDGVRRTAYKL